MRKEKNVKWANRFVNMTGEVFSLYSDGSGDIYTFYCDDRGLSLNRSPLGNREFSTVFYVVDEVMVDYIRRSGGVLDSIAMIRQKTTGRGGVEIAHLVWAKNPEIKVRLA